MRETDRYYLFGKHQFGQWTLRDMTDPDGVIYNCCEQYMMYKKAQLFADMKLAEEIIRQPDPSHQQKLGREVRGFDASIWDRHKIGIVWYANYLKFTQHSDLKLRLIATGDRTLAEASPYDLVWGIGFRASDDEATKEEMWRGQNLLGQTLMSVREVVKLVA